MQDGMRMFSRMTTIGATLGLAVSMAACSESGGGQSSTTGGSGGSTGDIKIGVVLDITGAGASLGVPERQTIEMLNDQINACLLYTSRCV